MDEGTVAVIGFFLCILVALLRKPIGKAIESRQLENPDVNKLVERCDKLETTVATVTSELLRVGKELEEIRNSSDFSYKLLLEQQANLVAISTRAKAERDASDTASGDSNAPKLLSTDAPKPEDFGKLTNEHTIRFERTLPGNKEQAWKYFTESNLLKEWLAEGKIETQFGGQVELNFAAGRNPGNLEESGRVTGLVSRAEEGKALCFSWEDEKNGVSSLLSLEFTEQDGKTKVVLTHSRLPKDRMHHFMACWHTFLDTLVARMRNSTPPDFHKRFREVIQIYLILVATVLAASPALAESVTGDYTIVTNEKTRLMAKYENLWRDVDSTQREMDVLRREGTSEAEKNLDYLDQRLKNQYRDIKDLEYKFKDLDAALRN